MSSGSPWEPKLGISRALRAGNRILVSGTAPIWPDGSCDPDPEVQAHRCFEIILDALGEVGAGPEHVVRTRIFLTSAKDGEAAVRGAADGDPVRLEKPAELRARDLLAGAGATHPAPSAMACRAEGALHGTVAASEHEARRAHRPQD